MRVGQKRLPARFYASGSGREPVREWLLDLIPEDRRQLGVSIAKVEFGWPIGMPYCRPMKAGLWEVRCDISAGRIARVLFCIEGEEMVLLHGFVKKTQATPKGELELARARMKEMQS